MLIFTAGFSATGFWPVEMPEECQYRLSLELTIGDVVTNSDNVDFIKNGLYELIDEILK